MLNQFIAVSLFALVTTATAAAQSTLAGRVLSAEGNDRSPAHGAWVVASIGSPPETIAAIEVDASGSYVLQGLPEGRVEFTVSQRGHITLEAGGSPSSILTRTCPASGSCGEADFVIARASVVEGYVTDPFGEPIADIGIELTVPGDSSTTSPRRPLHRTDDRGYFRLFDVSPGEYELQLQLDRLAGQVYSAEPQQVTVELGRSSPPLYIGTTAVAEPVRVGGVIDGLNLQDGEIVMILAASANGGRSRPLASISADTEGGGPPRLAGAVPPGDYILTAEIVTQGAGRRGERRVVSLGRRRIDHDTTDLRLTASQGATFAAKLRFEEMAPRRTNLSLVPLDGGTPDRVRFGRNGRFQGVMRGDNSVFERTALLPGRYRLEANSNDYFILGDTEFVLSDGATTETEIVLSGAFAEVRGSVRLPQADVDATGPFLIALKTPAGDVISTQTDAEGRYSFEKLEPGDYEICAWSDVSTKVADPQIWVDAGAAARRFPVAAGDQTEIRITAAK